MPAEFDRHVAVQPTLLGVIAGACRGDVGVGIIVDGDCNKVAAGRKLAGDVKIELAKAAIVGIDGAGSGRVVINLRAVDIQACHLVRAATFQVQLLANQTWVHGNGFAVPADA